MAGEVASGSSTTTEGGHHGSSQVSDGDGEAKALVDSQHTVNVEGEEEEEEEEDDEIIDVVEYHQLETVRPGGQPHQSVATSMSSSGAIYRVLGGGGGVEPDRNSFSDSMHLSQSSSSSSKQSLSFVMSPLSTQPPGMPMLPPFYHFKDHHHHHHHPPQEQLVLMSTTSLQQQQQTSAAEDDLQQQQDVENDDDLDDDYDDKDDPLYGPRRRQVSCSKM